jgi:hypothetical protein
VKPNSRKDALSNLLAAQVNDGSGLSYEEMIAATLLIIIAGEPLFLSCVYLKALTLPLSL